MLALLQVGLRDGRGDPINEVHERFGHAQQRGLFLGPGDLEKCLPADSATEAVGMEKVLQRHSLARPILCRLPERSQVRVRCRPSVPDGTEEELHVAARDLEDLTLDHGFREPAVPVDVGAERGHHADRELAGVDPIDDRTDHLPICGALGAV